MFSLKSYYLCITNKEIRQIPKSESKKFSILCTFNPKVKTLSAVTSLRGNSFGVGSVHGYRTIGGVCAYGEEVEGSREVSRVPSPRDAKPNQPVEQHTQAQHQEVPKEIRYNIKKTKYIKDLEVPVRYRSGYKHTL
jgi:hypothetical protein